MLLPLQVGVKIGFEDSLKLAKNESNFDADFEHPTLQGASLPTSPSGRIVHDNCTSFFILLNWNDMIRKEDIRRGLCFRTCWENEVADITITDVESGEKLPIRVPLRPFEFMVTDVYPRMGEVVVMGVERVDEDATGRAVGGTGSVGAVGSVGSVGAVGAVGVVGAVGGARASAFPAGVRMVDGCLPVRMSVERFLRFFGGYKIVDDCCKVVVEEHGQGTIGDGVIRMTVHECGKPVDACAPGDAVKASLSCNDGRAVSVVDRHAEAERACETARVSAIDEYERILEEIRRKAPYDYDLCRLCELRDGCVSGMWRGLLTGMRREWQRIMGAVRKPSGKRKDGCKEL